MSNKSLPGDVVELRSRITEALKSVKKFQTPNHKAATLQIINSFGPFIAVWVLMYFLWDVSLLAVIALGFFKCLVFS